MLSMREPLIEDLDAVQKRAYVIGGVGLLAAVVGWILNAEQFYESYLWTYLFWLGLSIGSLALLMLHHLVRGSWGFALQRILEAGARTFPLLILLFIPLVFGLEELYPWVTAEVHEEGAELFRKATYLNVPFFLARAVLYFSIWTLLGWLLARWSARLDDVTDLEAIRRMRRLSGPGLVVLVVTFTFAAIDWGMSLEPHWHSTIYGWMVIVGMTLESLAFGVVILDAIRLRRPFGRLLTEKHFHDLGNLTFAFVILWSYMMFIQFLIIWMGNIPEEIHWYLHRTGGGWEWIVGGLAIFHFFVPFFLLLLRQSKRRSARLVQIAVGLLVMRVLAVFWLIVPSFHPENLVVHWLDVVLLVGLGGVWVGTYLMLLAQRPLVPRHDPRMERILGYKPEVTG